MQLCIPICMMKTMREMNRKLEKKKQIFRFCLRNEIDLKLFSFFPQSSSRWIVYHPPCGMRFCCSVSFSAESLWMAFRFLAVDCFVYDNNGRCAPQELSKQLHIVCGLSQYIYMYTFIVTPNIVWRGGTGVGGDQHKWNGMNNEKWDIFRNVVCKCDGD